jgi:hypothetical protein
MLYSKCIFISYSLNFSVHISCTYSNTISRLFIKLSGREEAKLAKHSDMSWKQDHPSTLFGNSVQKAERLLKQVKSHPEEIAIEHAFNQIERAENAFMNAKEYGEHLDTVQQNKEYLEQIKQQLREMQGEK